MVLHIHCKKCLTIKSDDVSGRIKAYEAMIRGEEFILMLDCQKSFKVMIKEIRSLRSKYGNNRKRIIQVN